MQSSGKTARTRAGWVPLTLATAVVLGGATSAYAIVTSLGRVGGGGYVSSTLDAQRENNRLTGETNTLLKMANKQLSKMSNSETLAQFG